jgi:galactokinase
LTYSYFVPARANLIGEHTDYNNGLSLPFSLDLGIALIARPNNLDFVSLESDALGSWTSSEEAISEFQRQAMAVIEETRAIGVRLELSSTIPIGAGLSSSAAYIGALCIALGGQRPLIEMAQMAQRCEARAGNNVGLLDQLATLGSSKGCALLIDFSDLSFEDVPLPPSVAFTAVHSGVARSLATSEYALRRSQCDRARDEMGGWSSATLDQVKGLSDPLLRARARHVITENQRVRDAVVACQSDDTRTLGRLISESHASLRDDFEVSLPVIDELVAHVESQGGVLGARIMGGGFGGCVLVAHEPGVIIEAAGHQQWALRAESGAFERLGWPR